MSHHYVDLNRVSHRYPDGTEALRDVSLRVVHGESVGIVGPNGAGKSTLLMHLNGSLLPTSGSVDIGGTPLDAASRPEVRKRVGLVFQNADDQLFMPTVFDDVAFGPLNLGYPAERVRERVAWALEIVGCGQLAGRAPHHLSAGQKSAVAIATVIAMEPDVLVMDEPAANLDPRGRRAIISLLQAFTHSKIIASHDLDLVLDVCRRCVVMRDGRIVADGPTWDLLSNEALLEENHLELPLTLQRRRGPPQATP